MSNNTQKRIDELEQLTAAMVKSQQHLLTAQIIVNERHGPLEDIVGALATKIDSFIDEQKEERTNQKEERDQIRERMKHFDERVDKLVVSIGELIQRMDNGKK